MRAPFSVRSCRAAPTRSVASSSSARSTSRCSTALTDAEIPDQIASWRFSITSSGSGLGDVLDCSTSLKYRSSTGGPPFLRLSRRLEGNHPLMSYRGFPQLSGRYRPGGAGDRSVSCGPSWNGPAGKRLAPFMAEIATALERCGELQLTLEGPREAAVNLPRRRSTLSLPRSVGALRVREDRGPSRAASQTPDADPDLRRVNEARPGFCEAVSRLGTFHTRQVKFEER